MIVVAKYGLLPNKSTIVVAKYGMFPYKSTVVAINFKITRCLALYFVSCKLKTNNPAFQMRGEGLISLFIFSGFMRLSKMATI